MNVRDTLSHGDTPMSQKWLANVKPKKLIGRTRICTDRWKDRQTDRQTHRVIPIYSPELRSQGLY